MAKSFNPANPYFNFGAKDSSDDEPDLGTQSYTPGPFSSNKPLDIEEKLDPGAAAGNQILSLLRKEPSRDDSVETKVSSIKKLLSEFESKMEEGMQQATAQNLKENQGVEVNSSSFKYILPQKNEIQSMELNELVRYERKDKQEHPGSLISVNDQFVVYAISKGLVRVIKRSDKNVKTLFRHSDVKVVHVEISAAAPTVALSIDSSNQLRVWKIIEDDDKCLSTTILWDGKDVTASMAHFHPINPSVLGFTEKTHAKVYNFSQSKMTTFPAYKAQINDISFNAHRDLVATAWDDGLVRIFSVSKSSLVSEFVADAATVSFVDCVRFLGFSSVLLCGCGGGNKWILIDSSKPHKIGEIVLDGMKVSKFELEGELLMITVTTPFPALLMVKVSPKGFNCITPLALSTSVLSMAAVFHDQIAVYCIDKTRTSFARLNYSTCNMVRPSSEKITKAPVEAPKDIDKNSQKVQILPRGANPIIPLNPTPKAVEEPSRDQDRLSKKQSTENNLIQRLNKLFESHFYNLQQQLEISSTTRSRFESERIERLLHSISQSMHTILPQQIHQVMHGSNMQQVDVAGLQVAVETALGHINWEKELKTPLRDACSQMFASLVIPAFEKSFRAMFRQVEAHMQKYLVERESELAAQIAENNKLMLRMLDQMEIMSARGSPTHSQLLPSTTPKDRIDEFLSEKQYDRAFTEALNLGDLSIVLGICFQLLKEMWVIVPQLSSAVTLSLIHQLSFDLKNDTDLKLNWLSSSLLRLQKLSIDSEHVRPVLEQVSNNVSELMDEFSPSQEHTASLVLHIVHNLLHDSN